MTYAGRVEARIRVPSGVMVSATNGGSPKSVSLPANNYWLTDLLAMLQTQLNAYSDSSAWALSIDTTASGTGKVTITCTGTFSLTLTTELISLLGVPSFVGVSTPQVGTAGPVGVWFPDAPVSIDGDPLIAPVMTDLRSTRGPTGQVFGLGGGNRSYQHSSVKWQAVPKSRVWTVLETTANNSWQSFVTTTQHGQGTAACSSWFTLLSPVQLYGLDGVKFGTSLTNGWSLIGIESIAPKLTAPPLTSIYDIMVPTLVSATT